MAEGVFTIAAVVLVGISFFISLRYGRYRSPYARMPTDPPTDEHTKTLLRTSDVTFTVGIVCLIISYFLR